MTAQAVAIGGPRRRYRAAEVVQTSAMDCGPAALASLLNGFGVLASYGRLREVCQTDIDGTSIDTMERVANDLGLDCEQVLVPNDFLEIPAAHLLPAIVVVRLSSGVTHFVVAWRRHGPFVQLMDPAVGRRWVRWSQFLRDVYHHSAAVPAADFRQWVSSEEFLGVLRARFGRLGCQASAEREIARALSDPSWRSIARLDAALRMTQAVIRAGGLTRGREAASTVEMLMREIELGRNSIPDTYFTAVPAARDRELAEDEDQVLLRGAILVRAKGRSPNQETQSDSPSKDFRGRLLEPRPSALRWVIAQLEGRGLTLVLPLVLTCVAAALAVVVQSALIRGLIGAGRILGLLTDRATAVFMLVYFAVLLLLMELGMARQVLRVGSYLEGKLRMALFIKIPRMSDRYFHSRPVSDMAERAHAIHEVRRVPDGALKLVRAAVTLLATLLAIAWLDIASLPWLATVAVIAVVIPLAAQPMVSEYNLRIRTHTGALARLVLDAMLGLAPIRAHAAEQAMRREHEAMVAKWARASRSSVRNVFFYELAQQLGIAVPALALVLSYVRRAEQPSTIMLIIYWAVQLPQLGRDLALTILGLPDQRNRMLRFLEPLGSREVETIGETGTRPSEGASSGPERSGVSLAFHDVEVVMGGHKILEKIDLRIEPGSHVAIVGQSGAGKSSLLATLLGWYQPAGGRLLVDGAPLNSKRLQKLRQETAWVDPAVQIWNRSLFENVQFGLDEEVTPFGRIFEASDLHELLCRLPNGLQTILGEGGALVSGGEGQRIRFARALGRPGVRLALLDEPFRGLDRGLRHDLLKRARGAWWRHATLICVTHDVGQTLDFDHVVVMADGRIAEAGSPRALASVSGSKYAAMLKEEEALQRHAWGAESWRHLRMSEGRLVES